MNAHLVLFGPKWLKIPSDTSASFGQQEIQPICQTIVEKEYLWFDGVGGFYTDTEMAVMLSGLSEYGKEQHAGGQEEIK